jgi:hypothetical protein
MVAQKKDKHKKTHAITGNGMKSPGTEALIVP